MNEETFWSIIDLFDWSKTGDDDAVIEGAVLALTALENEEIFKFADILAEKLHLLDTREHYRGCSMTQSKAPHAQDYISGDNFLYLRCCAVANGRECWESALADPCEMPRDLWFEHLIYLPRIAFERKTGKEWDHESALSFESFENQAGWPPIEKKRK